MGEDSDRACLTVAILASGDAREDSLLGEVSLLAWGVTAGSLRSEGRGGRRWLGGSRSTNGTSSPRPRVGLCGLLLLLRVPRNPLTAVSFSQGSAPPPCDATGNELVEPFRDGMLLPAARDARAGESRRGGVDGGDGIK
jgi:hypothetical protein